MVIQLYNTLFRKKELFTPISKDEVKMYCCGPTVYNYAHIGNLRTYIFEDLLRRVLEYNNLTVTHILNVTDVGHLTDDADSGEDKMESGARRENKSVLDIANFYTDAFFEDLANLNILTPTKIAKATEHINEMIEIIKSLEKKGFTYQSNGNVYFDTSKFPYYCDLGKLNLDDMRSTDRVSKDEGKKHKADFVLWFVNSKFKNHSLKWDSPWGVGYPGWHIECSAMSSKYLGSSFDIHCGGVDHIQVHHTNEIAQSECAFGVHPWVRYWVHGEFLILNSGKMSKSGGSFITLNVLKKKGYDPLLYRFFCLNTHYRKQLSFSYSALDNYKLEFASLKKKILNIKSEFEKSNNSSVGTLDDIPLEKSELFSELELNFLNSLNDDLNIPKALGVLNDVIKSILSSGEKLYLIYDFDKIFGLDLKNLSEDLSSKLTQQEFNSLKPLLDQREIARENKDWVTSDKIRDDLIKQGYTIKDTPNGPILDKSK